MLRFWKLVTGPGMTPIFPAIVARWKGSPYSSKPCPLPSLPSSKLSKVELEEFIYELTALTPDWKFSKWENSILQNSWLLRSTASLPRPKLSGFSICESLIYRKLPSSDRMAVCILYLGVNKLYF